MRALLAWCMLSLLSGCGGGGSSTDSGPPVTPEVRYSLSGRAQKGPLAVGSQVSVSELGNDLNANGKVYNAQTTDNLGSFAFSTQIATRLVDISASGYYLDEITGRLSASVINLRATADLNVLPTPTVNALTSLQALRLKALMTQGQTFAAASTQSQTEVLTAFGVDAAKVNGLTSLSAMRIDGSNDADAVLLAVSATLAQMASDAAKANGTNQAAELSSLINTIASQLSAGGVITSASIVAVRKQAQTEINTSMVRSNVETYYSSQSAAIVAPKFEEWVDASGSGVLPQRQTPVTGLVFTDVTGANPATLVTSNTITVAGLGAGVSAAVAVDAGSTLIKNGQVVAGGRTIAQNGDTLAMRVTALGYGMTHRSTLSVGASSSAWGVASQALGGTITGVTGAGMVLQLNTAETIAVAAGGTSFAFASALANGAQFSIAVQTPPSGQICAVVNGTGTVGTAVAAPVVNCYAAGPAFITKVQGDAQTIVQHKSLPVIPWVQVTDRLGNPVVGASVTFRASGGYYAANPVTVSTWADNGVARMYIPVGDGSNMPPDIYFHTAGLQSVTASLAGGQSVKFDVNVTPSAHPFDGRYACTFFSLTIVDGVVGTNYFPSYSNFDEGIGKLEVVVGSNYKAHYYGQLDASNPEQAGLTGTYTASTFGGQSTDPIGNWSCSRL